MNAKTVKCPKCGKQSLFTPENPARPFCSDRCKLLDLGAWADEAYAIPAPPATPQEAEELMQAIETLQGESDSESGDDGEHRSMLH